MKNMQAHQHTSAEYSFKVIGTLLLGTLQIQFSKKHNAIYGPRDFFERLFKMCRNAEYAATEYSSDPDGGKGIPSGRWILGKIRPIRYDFMLSRCNRIVDSTVRRMKRRGMFRKPVDVAIDKHLIGRHDRFKRLVNVIKSKSKNGTCTFNCLATANCIIDGSRAFLASKLVRRIDANTDVVAGLIRECRSRGVLIRSLKMDREFFSTSVLNMLDAKDIVYQVPAVKTTGIKKAVTEFMEGKRDAVSRHSIKSADGTSAEFTLVILKRDKDRFFTLATNRTVQYVQEFKNGDATGAEAFAGEYRIRWGIETAYKDYESIRPRTTSSSESVRILLMLLPIFLFNAWVLAKFLLAKLDHSLTMTLKGLIKIFIRQIKDFGLNAAPPT